MSAYNCRFPAADVLLPEGVLGMGSKAEGGVGLIKLGFSIVSL
jgi:hypothetical protein